MPIQNVNIVHCAKILGTQFSSMSPGIIQFKRTIWQLMSHQSACMHGWTIGGHTHYFDF